MLISFSGLTYGLPLKNTVSPTVAIVFSRFIAGESAVIYSLFAVPLINCVCVCVGGGGGLM